MTRLLGLDHGSRRIGVAVADSETGLAFVRPAIRRRRGVTDLEAVAALAQDEHADRVVLGLPRNMDGSEGPAAAAVRRFGARLAAIGLDVDYADERLTSWQAADDRSATGGRRLDRRTGELDSLAARIILQEYLAAHPEESE
jgi:putative Holliday junction resolvase